MLLLLVAGLVLEIVHHRHPAPTRSAIDAAMLPLLVALVKHAVEVMRSGLSVGGSGWRGDIGRESGSNVTWRRAVAEDLVSGLRREEEVPSGRLRKPVTIGHLIRSARGRREALAQ